MTKIADFLRGEEPTVNPPISVDTEEKRIIGKVTKVDPKGWGFISSKDIPFTRVFFHWTSLLQNTLNFTELKKGMMVEFIPTKDEEKGTRAIKIKVLPFPDK